MSTVRPRGVLLDLDGTLYQAERPIAGAEGAVGALRDAGISIRFVTNTTRRPRSAVCQQLAAMGIAVDVDELVTAPLAALAWIRDQGLRSVAPLVAAPVLEDFAGVAVDEDAPEAVLVGDLGSDWTFERLNRAFRWLMAGAELIAIHKNRYWQTHSGLTLDLGAFVAALEYASGKTATVIGKPNRAFFELAARSMGLTLADVVMVGDDLVSDVGAAQRHGARGVLVRTGKFRAEDLSDAEVRPHEVVDSIADLPRLLLP